MQICALIDLENIGHAAVLPLLDGLAQPLHVVVFLGAKQKINGVAAALLERPHILSLRVVPMRTAGVNALDVRLACEVGAILAAQPQADVVIVSRDQIFARLASQLAAEGVRLRCLGPAAAPAAPKTAAAAKASGKTAPAVAPEAVRAFLGKIPPKIRPSTLQALRNYVRSSLRLDDEQAQAFVQAALAAGLVHQHGERLAYGAEIAPEKEDELAQPR